MKKEYYILLAKVVSFIILCVIIDIVIGSCLTLLTNKSDKHAGERNKISYVVEEVDADCLVIGASDASHHFDPTILEDSLQMSVFNCGNDGCFFTYQVCELRLILERYTPKLIIWEFGPAFLSTYYDKKYDYQSIRDLYKYYDNEYVRNLIDKESWSQRYLMISKLYRQNSLMYNIVSNFFLSPREDIVKGYLPLKDSGNNYPSLSHENNGGDLNSSKCELFDNTIKFIKSKGIQLVVTTTPQYNDFEIENQDYYNRMCSILKDNNVPYINYRHHPVFMNDSTMFRDYGHLNEKGVKCYMNLFIPDLINSLK